MRIWAIIISILLSAQVVAQQNNESLSLKVVDMPLDLVLDSITYKTGYKFSYNSNIIPSGSLYSVDKKNENISKVLTYLFTGINIDFVLLDDQIILKKKKSEQGLVPKEIIASNEIVVTGWVREYDTKLPIIGVNVFINGTTIGTTTDQYGNYKIKGIEPGTYDLVFSHISYQLANYALEAERGKSYAINGLLDFRVEPLGFIEIVSDPIVSEDEFPKFYKIFTREFLGTAPNGSKCEIINPEVLEFSYNAEEDIFKAEATEPLIIFNNALGYKITYNLVSFLKQYGKTSYFGKARFENLSASTGMIRKKWKRARLKSYRGSIFHFTRSLTRDELGSQGFRIFLIDDVDEFQNAQFNPVERETVLRNVKKQSKWELDFNGFLVIQYDRELESSQYLREVDERKLSGNGISSVNSFTRTIPDVQKSIIQLNRTFVTIDRNGQIIEPLGLSTIGYWAWERLSDLVPANYDPRNDNL